MAERTEDRTAALGSTVAVPPPPLPPAPTPAAAAEPLGDETAYVSARPERPRRSWRRWALIALVLALLVSVGVSAGALVADLTATPTHDVPAVKGLDVDAAREKLAANKWKIVEQRTRKDGTDPGEVLSVTPVAGTSLREGEQVTLLVSDGPTMADVPTDLAGTAGRRRHPRPRGRAASRSAPPSSTTRTSTPTGSSAWPRARRCGSRRARRWA